MVDDDRDDEDDEHKDGILLDGEILSQSPRYSAINSLPANSLMRICLILSSLPLGPLSLSLSLSSGGSSSLLPGL